MYVCISVPGKSHDINKSSDDDFWLFILYRVLWFFWNWKCSRFKNRRSVLRFRHLVLLNKEDSLTWTHVDAVKVENFPNAHESVFEVTWHQCLWLEMGYRSPSYFRELIFWVVSGVLGSITTAPAVSYRYICPRYKPPRAFSIPDRLWWWKTWHELMFNSLLRSRTDPVIPVMNCCQSPGWCFSFLRYSSNTSVLWAAGDLVLNAALLHNRRYATSPEWAFYFSSWLSYLRITVFLAKLSWKKRKPSCLSLELLTKLSSLPPPLPSWCKSIQFWRIKWYFLPFPLVANSIQYLPYKCFGWEQMSTEQHLILYFFSGDGFLLSILFIFIWF